MKTYEQVKEKLAVYHLEADIRRQLPRGVWRAELAQVFRRAAERLEPVKPLLESNSFRS